MILQADNNFISHLLPNTLETQGLFEEEIAESVRFRHPERKAQFLTGRAAAHLALKTAGLPDGPVLRAESGAAIWPKQVIGSISHNDSHAIAAVLPVGSHWRFLGIDLESKERILALNLQKKILHSAEAEHCQKHPADFLVIFQLKEALFKACFPLVQTHFGFLEAEVHWSGANQATLQVSGDLQKRGCPPTLQGGWCQWKELQVAWVVG